MDKQFPGMNGPSGQSLGTCPLHGHQDVDPHWIPFVLIPCKYGSSVLGCTDLPAWSGNTSSLDGVLLGSIQMVDLLLRS